MAWLSYLDDEVLVFHPAFSAAANLALAEMNLVHLFEWIHHVRTPGNSVIPDFVLRDKASGQWLLAFEIKRRKDAVYSTRNQIQAHGYALTNQTLYRPSAPRYYAISNLEITILAALDQDHPPSECHVQGGYFESGNFQTDDQTQHSRKFVNDLIAIIDYVIANRNPVFDIVWPGVLGEFNAFASGNPHITLGLPNEPNTLNWPIVKNFFSSHPNIDSARLFFLRCLMAEYLRGALIKNNHPKSNQIPPLRPDKNSVANTIAAFSQIDFNTLFEPFAPDIYRSIVENELLIPLQEYSATLVDPKRRIVDLAQSRTDSYELIDSLLPYLYPPEIQDRVGKVQTDPELATILARVTIPSAIHLVLDPCCGDGILLSAAYDLSREFGVSNEDTLNHIKGIEADPISVRLSEIRLALKQPSTLSPNNIEILYGDLFTQKDLVGRADVILMNPPFVRYEEHDGINTPLVLRDHYANAIRNTSGQPPSTTGGQANLFNYYVEYVIRNTKPGTFIGIILDNKWYQNRNGIALKKLMLDSCKIIGILEYPYSTFFTHWTIATSIVVLEKTDQISAEHTVKFVRSKVDPRSVDLNSLANAFHHGAHWPMDWTCQLQEQRTLNPIEGWKSLFQNQLQNNFRALDWPILEDLFDSSRRGSLEKEQGGVGILEFPFNRSNYGPVRLLKEDRVGYQTEKGRELTEVENSGLRELAAQIPLAFRGRALRNSDDPENYILTIKDIEKQQTLEMPILRSNYQLFLNGRSDWTDIHNQALVDFREDIQAYAFIDAVENLVNLNENVLPRPLLWNVLREPIAGELIIPRKTRVGHWVNVNPFVFDLTQPQIRVSSNFISFMGCNATDVSTGLSRETATKLIAAFLVSSFGQIQFEMEGYNREGLLAVEKHHLRNVKIFDPRWIQPHNREAIIDAFNKLPYKISTSKFSAEHPERNRLDELLGQEIVNFHQQFELNELLNEVHLSLDEWVAARQP